MAYMSKTTQPPTEKVTALRTSAQRETLQRLAADLGWTPQRFAGFSRRICGQPDPRTTRECQQVHQGLEQMLLRLMRPHWPAFDRLVDGLLTLRYEMTPWERQFLPDVARRRREGQRVSPKMVKLVRQIAHKYSVECGFPRFAELAQAADAHRQPTTTTGE